MTSNIYIYRGGECFSLRLITNPKEFLKIVKGRFRLTRFCLKKIFFWLGEGDGEDVVPNFIKLKKSIKRMEELNVYIYIYILLLYNNH